MSMGLVFGGGGAKGAYQVGVWKALDEMGLKKEITAVAGTSVGGLNAALFAMGGFNSCFNIWLKITQGDILCKCQDKVKESLLSVVLGYDGFFEQSCLESIIRESITPIHKMNCYIACSYMSRIPFFKLPIFELYINRLFRRNARYFDLKGMDFERTVNTLLATTAIPFIYEGVAIDKRLYCDGGLCDNLPIKPLYDAGIRNIFAVSLDNDPKIDTKKFPNADIRLLKPSSDLGNFISGTLNFTKEKLEDMIHLGYSDTKKFFANL